MSQYHWRSLTKTELWEDLLAIEASSGSLDALSPLVHPSQAEPPKVLKKNAKSTVDSKACDAADVAEILRFREETYRRCSTTLQQICRLLYPLDHALVLAATQLGFCEAGRIFDKVDYPADFALTDMLHELVKPMNADSTFFEWPSKQNSYHSYRRTLIEMPNFTHEDTISLENTFCWPDITQDKKDAARDAYIINGTFFEGNLGLRVLMNTLAAEVQETPSQVQESSSYTMPYKISSTSPSASSLAPLAPYNKIIALLLLHLANRTFSGSIIFETLVKYFNNTQFGVIRPISAEAEPSKIVIIPSAGYAILHVHFRYSIYLLDDGSSQCKDKLNSKPSSLLYDSNVASSNTLLLSEEENESFPIHVYYTAFLNIKSISYEFLQSVERHMWETQKKEVMIALLLQPQSKNSCKLVDSEGFTPLDKLSMDTATLSSEEIDIPMLHQKVYICK